MIKLSLIIPYYNTYNYTMKLLKELQLQLEQELQIPLPYLSMGMSDDYLIAIEEGATHIRLGRILYK